MREDQYKYAYMATMIPGFHLDIPFIISLTSSCSIPQPDLLSSLFFLTTSFLGWLVHSFIKTYELRNYDHIP